MSGRQCITGKKKFESSLDALLYHSKNPRRVRAYRCPKCHAFHVTSQPKAQASDFYGAAA